MQDIDSGMDAEKCASICSLKNACIYHVGYALLAKKIDL